MTKRLKTEKTENQGTVPALICSQQGQEQKGLGNGRARRSHSGLGDLEPGVDGGEAQAVGGEADRGRGQRGAGGHRGEGAPGEELRAEQRAAGGEAEKGTFSFNIYSVV